jgi:subtilisin family serine protease
VIDTGIYTANVDFGGRATFGFKAEAEWSQNDANGHGTHVASTIMGTQYGVARAAHAIAVKVLGDNGSGSNAGVIAGVEWATQQGRGKSSVINMSLGLYSLCSFAHMRLGGSFSQALNNAVDAAADAGLVVVVAAGNSNVDACSSSPASATEVICVGATSEGLFSLSLMSYPSFRCWSC